MPIVSTETVSFDGSEYRKQVRCNSGGVFSIKLPPTVTAKTKVEEVIGDSMADVLEVWRETMEQYRESQTESRKVIAYKIQADDDISFAHGMSLSIWAKVFIEYRTNVPGKPTVYKYEDVDFDEMLPEELRQGGIVWERDIHERNVIDWTQERHEFFIAIHKAMSQLIDKIRKLDDKKNLLKAVDSGVKYLEQRPARREALL